MCLYISQVLHFATTVRSKEQRQLMITNKSSTLWQLVPVIDGQYWSGANSFEIEPNTYRHYEITYHPLTMTSDNSKHSGSVFFPLPDGTGLLYNLIGTAEPPKPAGVITQEIPCKTPHTELLAVTNWLKRSQR